MCLSLSLSAKWRVLLQSALVYIWLSTLAGTDSRFSVYALCGVLGVLCLFRNTLLPPPDEKIHPRKSMAFMAFLFAAATVGANYTLFLPFGLVSLLSCLLSLAGGFTLGYHVLLYGLRHLPLAPFSGQRKRAGLLFWFVFLSVAVVDIPFLFVKTYPGILTTDSLTTMAQINTGIYNNTMPFYHTVLVGAVYRLGMVFLKDPNASVALFHVVQILFLGAVFGYTLVTLYQAGAPVWFLTAAYGVYVLLPYNIVFGSTLWKDVPFGASALLLTVAFYRLLRKIGTNTRLNYLCLILGSLGLCLLRTNGWYAFAATTLIMLLLRKTHKKLLLIMCVITLICWILIGPVLTFLGVEEGSLVEAFAVPFQQLARVIVNERPLTAEEYELLSYMFKIDKLKEVYNPLSVDPVKFETFYYSHVPSIRENIGQYLKMYLRLGLRYPGDYLAAWADETKGFWNGGYEYWIYTLKHFSDNPYGLFSSPRGGLLASIYSAWIRLLEVPVFLRVLYSIGLQVWILFYCFAMNLWKQREEFLLALPLLVLVAGLWLGTPVYAEFRYAYPMFTTVPLILGVTLFHPKTSE